MDIEKYESLLETLEILGDPEALKAPREASREEEMGKFLFYEEVWSDCETSPAHPPAG